CQQPCQGDLRGRGMSFGCDPCQQVDDDLVGPARFGGEAGNGVAEIAALQDGVRVDGAGQKTFSQRTEWDEADTQFREGGNDLVFRLAPPQRIFALQRRYRQYRMGAADGSGAGL